MSTCEMCRHWSEMLGRGTRAVCLSPDGPRALQYTLASFRCDKYAKNYYGAVDSPPNYGKTARAAYESNKPQG